LPAHCDVQPQTFGTLGSPPPHVSGATHAPQSIVLPHPSGIVPQFLPWATQVVGVQPQAPFVPPPPHVSWPVQDLHAAPPVPQRWSV
jgi:hypothetical protein